MEHQNIAQAGRPSLPFPECLPEKVTITVISISNDNYFFPCATLFHALSSVIHNYMENAKIIVDALQLHGLKACRRKNAPYVWIHFPGSKFLGLDC
ncbi:LL-diaminopimelate aminotransferase [Melia azedarach]|uniref:LL-diaminopimelate aminotransferase n=1 Tax=Melia azedarach TaxID=155640 RepID=A0ACC1WQ54_MELAZ|nr:LL-diaminopimelate aminotransferase [Melia azedarach]